MENILHRVQLAVVLSSLRQRCNIESQKVQKVEYELCVINILSTSTNIHCIIHQLHTSLSKYASVVHDMDYFLHRGHRFHVQAMLPFSKEAQYQTQRDTPQHILALVCVSDSYLCVFCVCGSKIYEKKIASRLRITWQWHSR